MKPSFHRQALNKAIEAKRPVMLWGAPGVGKSDVVAQVAEKRGVELRDVRLSLLDPVDLKGFPIPDHDNKQMTWLPPHFLPAMTVKKARALLNTKDGKKTALPDHLMPNDSQGILFLDELPSAPQAVQAAAYQLILNREIGNYTLPEGWAIIAAGNREEDRAVVHKMPSALANRFVHLNFDIHLDDWCEWALDNGIEHGQRAGQGQLRLPDDLRRSACRSSSRSCSCATRCVAPPIPRKTSATPRPTPPGRSTTARCWCDRSTARQG